MFGTSPFVPMALAMGSSIALCLVLTFPKFEKERKRTTSVDYFFLFGIHISLKILVIVMLAEIYFTIFPELDLSTSEKSSFKLSEVQNSRTLSLWMLIVSVACLATASLNVLYKKSKGVFWLILFAASDFFSWLAVNKFLDYVSS